MLIHFDSPNYDVAQNLSHIQTERFLIHSHPYYELHYVVRGDVDIISSGKVFPATPHGLTLFTPDVAHGIRVKSASPYERYTVHFTQDLITAGCRKLLDQCVALCVQRSGVNHLNDLGTTLLPKLLRELMQIRLLSAAEQRLLVPCMIEGMIGCIYMNLQASAQPIGQTKQSFFSSQDVISYIHLHYMERLSLEQLADVFYCSKGHLSKVFKQETGTTIMSYINRRRLMYAHALLENGYSALSVASLCGFTEYSSFYRAYVKQYNCPPSQNAAAASSPNSLELLPSMPAEFETELPPPEPAHRTIWELVPEKDRVDDDPSILVDQ